jgi:hypothetical protein
MDETVSMSDIKGQLQADSPAIRPFLMLSACQEIEDGAQRDRPDGFKTYEYVKYPLSRLLQPLATYESVIT